MSSIVRASDRSFDEIFPPKKEGGVGTTLRESLLELFGGELAADHLSLKSELEILQIPNVGTTRLASVKFRLGMFNIPYRPNNVSMHEWVMQRYPNGPATIPIELLSTICNSGQVLRPLLAAINQYYGPATIEDAIGYDKDAMAEELEEACGTGPYATQVADDIEQLKFYLHHWLVDAEFLTDEHAFKAWLQQDILASA